MAREKIETTLVEAAAAQAYAVHRIYRAGQGENLPTWGNAEWNYKNRLRAAARKILEEELDAEGAHASFVAEKLASGWSIGDGDAKDESTRKHPFIVPWEELPGHERAARALFASAVHGAASQIAASEERRARRPSRAAEPTLVVPPPPDPFVCPVEGCTVADEHKHTLRDVLENMTDDPEKVDREVNDMALEDEQEPSEANEARSAALEAGIGETPEIDVERTDEE